jgi:tRNA(Ile)-lysidine synthase
VTTAREQVRRALRTAALRSPQLFAPHTRLVVAFSGGQDSTCLLHALGRERRTLELIVAHVDHGLRPDSAASAQQAVALAHGLGAAQVIVRRVDVAAYRRLVRRWSVQQAARAARYQTLAAIVQETAAAALLVAHTADDQAETVLLNLLRGSGLAGLAGMRANEEIDPRTLGPRPAELASLPPTLHVARPLLRVSRATTLAYCTEVVGLPLVEDASNLSRAYTRNRVRLDLLPVLEGYNPAVRSVLARMADLVAEDLAALQALVERLHAQLARRPEPERLEYDLRAWGEQPRALQRRLLRHAVQTLLGGQLADVPANPIEDALDLLASAQPEQAYHLPYGIELRTHRATFEVRLHGAAMPKRRANIGAVLDSRV